MSGVQPFSEGSRAIRVLERRCFSAGLRVLAYRKGGDTVRQSLQQAKQLRLGGAGGSGRCGVCSLGRHSDAEGCGHHSGGRRKCRRGQLVIEEALRQRSEAFGDV